MKFITVYWSQITIVLLGIGFIIQKVIDYNLKLKEVKFNAFHIERANFIREIYSDLMELQKDLALLDIAHSYNDEYNTAIPDTELTIVLDNIVKKNKAMKEKVLRYRILFSPKFIKKINKLFSVIQEEFIKNSFDKRILAEKPDYTFSNSDRFKDYYKTRFPILMKNLEKEFRKYL